MEIRAFIFVFSFAGVLQAQKVVKFGKNHRFSMMKNLKKNIFSLIVLKFIACVCVCGMKREKRE